MNNIEKMLAEGATPESIYQEALGIVKRQNEARAAASKKMEDKRTAVIKALVDYSELLMGEKMPTNVVSEIEEALKELEGIVQGAAKIKKPEQKKDKPTRSDKERMMAFLKSIGAVD